MGAQNSTQGGKGRDDADPKATSVTQQGDESGR